MRRGILSTISSICDLVGFIVPLQVLYQYGCLGSDDKLYVEHHIQWKNWLNELPSLAHMFIKRCEKPGAFGQILSKQIHIFADANTTGYGAVAYLHLRNESNKIHCISDG